jgi:signal transduction histidine kinase
MKKCTTKVYSMITGALCLGLLIATSSVTAGHHEGTAMEAKAMLQRAAAALKADQSAALTAFTAGTDGFKDRDLYVFCSGPDGKMTAHGANSALIGKNFCGFVDKAGKKFGQEMCSNASGGINTVEYMWPRPGESEPSQKASYYLKAGNQICGVGFYQ